MMNTQLRSWCLLAHSAVIVTLLGGCSEAAPETPDSTSSERLEITEVDVWQPARRLPDELPGRAHFGAALAVGPDNELVAAWIDVRDGQFQVFSAVSRDGGASFSDNVEVDFAGRWTQIGGSLAQRTPDVAVGPDSTIYVVWSDNRETYYGYDTWLARSADGGQTFEPSIRVSEYSRVNYSTDPDVAVGSDGTVFVIWSDDRAAMGNADVYLARSTDGGQSFGANVRVDDAEEQGTQEIRPRLGVDPDGNVHAVWAESPSSDVRHARSTDGGLTFSASQKINPLGSVGTPDIATDSLGSVYIVYKSDQRTESKLYYDIMLAKSEDNGVSFAEPQQVNSHDGSARRDRPRVAVDSSDVVYVAWLDARRSFHHDVYLNRSTDLGASFGADLRIDDRGESDVLTYSPSLGVDDIGRVYVSWDDKRYGGEQDVFFVRATPAEQRLVAQYRNGDPDDGQLNAIRPEIRLVNDGEEAVSLDQLTARYWFTNEAAPSSSVASVLSAQVTVPNQSITSAVTVAIGSIARADTADTYVEVGFTEDAGTLAPGAAVLVQLDVHPEDWSNYDESNDHSFLPDRSYVDHPNLTVYREGIVVWGDEPLRWGKELP